MIAQGGARRGHLALFAGLLAISTSGPFFMMAHVPALSAVFLRTLLAGALGIFIAAARGTLRLGLLRAHSGGLALGGALLGVHLFLWSQAFALTDYASNLLLLVAQPIIAAFVSARAGEPLPRHGGRALALAMVGMTLIAGGDFARGPRALLGDALCVAAGAMMALFYVVGRRARAALALDAFMGSTMLAASAVTLPVALAARVPVWGFDVTTWSWLAAITVITTLFGHGMMNLAARNVPLFSINLVVVLEPMVAIAMGAVLFGATVTLVQCAGGAILAIAVFVGIQPPSAMGKPVASLVDEARSN